MTAEQIQRVTEEVHRRHAAELQQLKADGSQIEFVYGDSSVEEEARSVGYRFLDFIEGVVVRVVRSVKKKGIIYLLLGGFLLGEVTHYYHASPHDAPIAHQEYVVNFSSWYQRSLAPQSLHFDRYLVIPPQEHSSSNPHVPEEDYSRLLLERGSIVAPISGFSESISGHYIPR
ncbi:MAG: hypothetical protein HYV95_16200 [Opitutae bacterium]|nr:hypothetical protein [Opitutae bacterium]